MWCTIFTRLVPDRGEGKASGLDFHVLASQHFCPVRLMAQDAPAKGTNAEIPQVEGPKLPAHVTSSSQQTPSSNGNNRGELISKARAFLHSPQIQGQEIPEKRRFLAEKGLNDNEINGLLYEFVRLLGFVASQAYVSNSHLGRRLSLRETILDHLHLIFQRCC